MNNCENCNHWERSKTSFKEGHCRRYPPSIVWDGHQVVTLFPKTLYKERCGEWIEIKEEYEQYPVIE